MNIKDLQNQLETTIKASKILMDEAAKKLPTEEQIKLNRDRQKVNTVLSEAMASLSNGTFNAEKYSQQILNISNGANSNK